jgi:hypothetical protein
MNPRLITGVLIVLGSLVLLLVVNALTGEASEPWKIGALISVGAIYAGLLWMRDRFFPAKGGETREGGSSPAMQKVGKPWLLLVVSFVLIAVPLMIIMRSDVVMEPSESTRLAFKVTAWGMLVPTIALLIARFPANDSAVLFEWWLPSGLLLLLSMVSVRLLPGLVLLIAGQTGANSPNVATLLVVPLAAFVFRSLQFVRKNPGR